MLQIYKNNKLNSTEIYKDSRIKTNNNYYLTSRNNSVEEIYTSSGTKTKSYNYSAYGIMDARVEGYTYTGEQQEKNGLIYLRARYYKPEYGVFITKDTYKGTTTNILSQNQYTYVENNPIKYVDSSGNAATAAKTNASEAIKNADLQSKLNSNTPTAGLTAGLKASTQTMTVGAAVGATAGKSIATAPPKVNYQEPKICPISTLVCFPEPLVTRTHAKPLTFSEQLLEGIVALGKGSIDFIDNMSQHLANAVLTFDLVETLKGISNIVVHPIQTLQGLYYYSEGLIYAILDGDMYAIGGYAGDFATIVLFKQAAGYYLGQIKSVVQYGKMVRISKAAGELINYGQKSENYLTKRGWTWNSAKEVVNNPYTTRQAFSRVTQNSATAYYNKIGEYIVVDNITGELVQASMRGDLFWNPDPSIINPYIPK